MEKQKEEGAQIGIDASRVFTIIHDCKVPIWPAITPGNNFGGGGFVLRPGESRIMTAPAGWSGRIWARTGCKFDGSGNGSCQTGSCGSTLHCSASGKPPASLAEFTSRGSLAMSSPPLLPHSGSRNALDGLHSMLTKLSRVLSSSELRRMARDVYMLNRSFARSDVASAELGFQKFLF